MSGTSILAYVILTLSIGYVFAYPSFNEISSLMAEKDKYESSLSTVAEIENKKNELLTKFNQISEADRKNIDTVLPNSLDFVRLISQIDAVAARHGISIDRLSSKELDSSVGESIAEAEPPKPYRSSLVGFSFTASYDKFNSFMDDMEKSLRILDVRSVKIGVKDKGEYSYSVEFEAYWLKSS